jgi:hypothetical protein
MWLNEIGWSHQILTIIENKFMWKLIKSIKELSQQNYAFINENQAKITCLKWIIYSIIFLFIELNVNKIKALLMYWKMIQICQFWLNAKLKVCWCLTSISYFDS